MSEKHSYELKLDWAEQHLIKFEGIVTEYVASHPYEMLPGIAAALAVHVPAGPLATVSPDTPARDGDHHALAVLSLLRNRDTHRRLNVVAGRLVSPPSTAPNPPGLDQIVQHTLRVLDDLIDELGADHEA